MTTNFALSLSFEGIQLLHRVTGGWRLVGEADVQADDLDAVLADLRRKALALEPGGLRTKIVIPLDQIKYLALDTTQTDMDDIHAALDGATPYALNELVIDYERRGGRTHIAAVARETLQEAEAFARAHQFNPVAFVAIPEPFTFQSEVFFGPTATMTDVLGMGATVERDILPIMIVGTRIKSRLLIFDIPEDELPPSDGPDLATLLAPHVEREKKEPTAEIIAAPEADPLILSADDAQVAEPVDIASVISEATADGADPQDEAPLEDDAPDISAALPVDETTTAPIEATTEIVVDVIETGDATDAAAIIQDDQIIEVEEPDIHAAAPITDADLSELAAAENVDEAPQDQPELPLEAEAVSADVVTSSVPDQDTRSEEVAAITEVVLAPDDNVVPLVADTQQPTRRDPEFSLSVDPIIAEYHTARPKYKRRARRRIVGTLTPVVAAPPPGAPTIASVSTAPVAPTPPARIATANAPSRVSKKMLVGTAIAASFALIGLLAWIQFGTEGQDATDGTGEPAAEAASADTASIVPAAAPESAAQDNGPRVALLELIAEPTPLSAEAGLNIPGDEAAVAVRGSPLLPPASEPDDVLATVTPMPTSVPEDTAQAEVGAPVLRGRVLSPDEAARIYEATGVWQRAPRIVDVPETTTADKVNWPGPVPAPSKVAQPIVPDAGELTPELTFVAPADPPPPDVTFELDADGFIAATPEGALTPEGAVVVAGLPDLTVRARPDLTEDDLARMAALAPAPEGVVIIAGAPPVTPPLRPADTVVPEEETSATPGAVTLAGLQPDRGAEPLIIEGEDGDDVGEATGPRPRLRPVNLTPPEPPADLPSNPDITSVIAGIAQDAAAEPFIDMTPRAVGASRRPQTRPRNFATVVANARQRQAAQQQQRETATAAATPVPQATVAVVPPRNTSPAPGGVARAATQEDAIRLRDINLIGVYGRPNDRRALVRLPNGSYVRVEIGSALDGGQVTAIGDNALNYVKRGRTYALQVPSG